MKYGLPIADRLMAKREVTVSGCWMWAGCRNNCGYGCMKIGQRQHYTHRLAYEVFVGPIADGLQIDHLCRNRACFNPRHLEPVPPKVNYLRGVGLGALNLRKTHCPQGHLLPEVRDKNGWRRCGECAARHSAAYKRRRREARRMEEAS